MGHGYSAAIHSHLYWFIIYVSFPTFLEEDTKKEVQTYRLNKQNDNICILFIAIIPYEHKKLRSAFKTERSIL